MAQSSHGICSPLGAPWGNKEVNRPKRNGDGKPNQKRRDGWERARVQILNLQSSRNPGWHQYPRDPIAGSDLDSWHEVHMQVREQDALSLWKRYWVGTLYVLVTATPHIPGYVAQEASLLSWGWRARLKLFKLPEMEQRGTLGNNMTIPVCPSTCKKINSHHH